MSNEFPSDPEPLLATLARLFTLEGAAREVAVLANAEGRFDQTDYDNWNGGTFTYCLYLQIPESLYSQLFDELKPCEEKILEKAQHILAPFPNDILGRVAISPILKLDPSWREKARASLAGSGISNQGRVRSDNVASRTCDGLLFRSQQEIHLYKALKSLGVSFAPLPVFVRGGNTYKRIEPDFVILKDGIIMIVEVDGDTVHRETPAEAHARTTMLVHEGAHIERVRASECENQELAMACAKKLIQIIDKLKAVR